MAWVREDSVSCMMRAATIVDRLCPREGHVNTDILLVPMSARWSELRAAALAADEAGFDGVWTWDHLRDPEGDTDVGIPEAMIVLAALAEVTRRLAPARSC
jgi:alkanesulfonate monooxygenase SsuD/methylene tetrahydromethanopterin reductase-like flavin-dependent oxidoreductase (luciferase family)